ncbi:MAG: tRNA dihydrouridine synthase DusB [Alphaproteobacteria bacterium]
MRIGNLDFGDRVPIILAPLAGYTDFAFRKMCRRFQVDLTVSEMISADGLVFAKPKSKGFRKTVSMLEADSTDHPWAAQLFGKDPERLAAACRIVEHEAQIEMIDLNAGCPVRKVVGSGHGVALMRDPAQLNKILSAMRKATDLPLTVKLRAGAEQINVVECARAAEEAGVDAITVHPRTKAQQFTGEADWTLIAQVKQAVRVPVIGNGDVRSGEDAARLVRETGCDAVMIGRGAVGRPWIFAEARAALDGKPAPPPLDNRAKRELLEAHLGAMIEHKGEERAAKEIRKFALQMVKGVRRAASARQAIATAPNAARLLEIVAEVLPAQGDEHEPSE